MGENIILYQEKSRIFAKMVTQAIDLNHLNHLLLSA
jgi:hypothetical protein